MPVAFDNLFPYSQISLKKMGLNMDTAFAVSLGQAMQSNKNAADWQAYAHRLEQELRLTKANNFGYAAIKDAAIAELARLDPRNYLLVQQNRQKLFEDAKNAQLSGKKTA